MRIWWVFGEFWECLECRKYGVCMLCESLDGFEIFLAFPLRLENKNASYLAKGQNEIFLASFLQVSCKFAQQHTVLQVFLQAYCKAYFCIRYRHTTIQKHKKRERISPLPCQLLFLFIQLSAHQLILNLLSTPCLVYALYTSGIIDLNRLESNLLVTTTLCLTMQ